MAVIFAAGSRIGLRSIAGKSLVSFHRDGREPDPSGRCFAFVQTVDDKPRARLVDTLRQQGMQPQQQVVFLSDGADTLRRLQQNIAPEAEHVLDWFHVAMRLTVLGQMIKCAQHGGDMPVLAVASRPLSGARSEEGIGVSPSVLTTAPRGSAAPRVARLSRRRPCCPSTSSP